LIAAERAAMELRERADSLELVIVSSFADAAWDEATARLRARWPGRARLVPLPMARGDTSPATIAIREQASDPVRAALVRVAPEGDATVRIVRDDIGPSDSAWVRAGQRALVHWPTDGAADSVSAQGVVAGDVVLAAPLVRRPLGSLDEALVIATFADGAPAIVERTYGEGCIREVAFDFPRAGDVPLRESSRRIGTLLTQRCQQQAGELAMDVARLDSLRGEGALRTTASLPRSPQRRSEATSWLLILGALLLLGEVAVRRQARAT
jgi:hypothetical protein